MAANANIFGSLSYDTYRSPGTITGSNASNFVETAVPPFLGGTGVNNNKLTKVYNPTALDGTDQVVPASDLEAQPLLPNKVAFWQRKFDYYTNGGDRTRTYLQNSAQPVPALGAATGGPSQLPDPNPATQDYSALYAGGPLGQLF